MITLEIGGSDDRFADGSVAAELRRDVTARSLMPHFTPKRKAFVTKGVCATNTSPEEGYPRPVCAAGFPFRVNALFTLLDQTTKIGVCVMRVRKE